MSGVAYHRAGHGVGLPRAGLAVREHSGRKAVQRRVEQLLHAAVTPAEAKPLQVARIRLFWAYVFNRTRV